MSKSKFVTGLAMVLMVAMVCGCASLCGSLCGSSPAKQASAAMDAYHAAMKAKDLDKMVGAFSDAYSNSQGSDKSMLSDHFSSMIDQGVYDTIEINTDECTAVADGKKVKLGPVYYSNTGYEYELKKDDDGVWRIISSEPY